jgi:hypothetical protein
MEEAYVKQNEKINGGQSPHAVIICWKKWGKMRNLIVHEAQPALHYKLRGDRLELFRSNGMPAGVVGWTAVSPQAQVLP